MVRNVLKLNWKKFAIVFLGYIIFNIIWFSARQIYREMVHQRDYNTIEMVNDILYTEEQAQSEIKLLENYVKHTSLSNRSLGYIYKALAKLYYMTGDDNTYNDQVSKAFYYLYISDEYNELADMYTQYMGKLYANGAYETCEVLFDKLNSKIDISKCDLDVQISYYLGAADAEEMIGNDEEAADNISSAQELLAKSEEYHEKKVDQAKADMLLVRNYINKKEYEEAEKIMSKYSKDDTFGLESDNMFLVCDYTMPYYEMYAKLCLYEQKYDEISDYIQKYIDYCDSYNFRRMKLNLLSYFDDMDAYSKIPGIEKYSSIHKELTNETLNEFSEQYGKYLLAVVDDQINVFENTKSFDEYHRRILYGIISCIFFIILFIVFINRLMVELRIDGLTRLRNRKNYEEDREKLYHKKEAYYCLILDIDDFKNVNDTFGHQKGDEVLVGISAILRNYENGYTRCYRYGGEELCVLFKNKNFETTKALAEQIRITIENELSTEDVKITVSGGLAYSADGGNAFRRADNLLYTAKANGKNQIACEQASS